MDDRDIKYYSKQLEIHPYKGEIEGDFRARLAKAVIEVYDDSLLAAEILLGKKNEDFNKDDEMISLALHVLGSQEKEKKMRANGDSYYLIPWKNFELIVQEANFKKVFSYDFVDFSRDIRSKEEYAIHFNYEKNMLLTAESYAGKKDLNSTTLYYELCTPKKIEELDGLESIMLENLFNDSSFNCVTRKEEGDTDTFFVSKDGREGLVGHIRSLDTSGFSTNNPWKYYDHHFLWLCDYSETKSKKYDYQKIQRKKIACLPDKVREMIGCGF